MKPTDNYGGTLSPLGNASNNGSVSTKGTISEQCITAVIADYNNSKINLIRIGRGSDREINILKAE